MKELFSYTRPSQEKVRNIAFFTGVAATVIGLGAAMGDTYLESVHATNSQHAKAEETCATMSEADKAKTGGLCVAEQMSSTSTGPNVFALRPRAEMAAGLGMAGLALVCAASAAEIVSTFRTSRENKETTPATLDLATPVSQTEQEG